MTWEDNPAGYNPPYCFGAGYMLSMAAAADVVRVAPDMKPVRMEDVYIGLCLREVRYRGNFQHRIHHMPEFLNMMTVNKTCCKAYGGLHTKVVWHVASPAFMANAWNAFKHECNLEWEGAGFIFCATVQLSQCRHGPLSRYVKLRVVHAPGMPGTFSPPPVG